MGLSEFVSASFGYDTEEGSIATKSRTEFQWRGTIFALWVLSQFDFSVSLSSLLPICYIISLIFFGGVLLLKFTICLDSFAWKSTDFYLENYDLHSSYCRLYLVIRSFVKFSNACLILVIPTLYNEYNHVTSFQIA